MAGTSPVSARQEGLVSHALNKQSVNTMGKREARETSFMEALEISRITRVTRHL